MEASPLPWLIVLLAALAGGVSDLRSGRIPNRLTLPLWAAGLLWGAYSNGGQGLIGSVGGSLLLLIPFFLLFLFAGGGAGDAKLMAAIGAWVGLPASVTVLVAVTVSGALLGLVLALARGQGRRLAQNMRRLIYAIAIVLATRRLGGTWLQYAPDPATRMIPMRYGAAIFLGVCLAAVLQWS